MPIIFKSHDAEAEQFRTLVIRRVKFAMRPLSWLAPSVWVQLSDINGPRGGVDKRCQIELTTISGGPPVIVTSFARDWLSALQSALARATRSLLHNLKRSRKNRTATTKLASSN